MSKTYYFVLCMLCNESDNKMKVINFVFSILRQTYPSITHLWCPWNEHSKTNLGYIKLLIYRSIYSGPLDFDISEFYCICLYMYWSLWCLHSTMYIYHDMGYTLLGVFYALYGIYVCVCIYVDVLCKLIFRIYPSICVYKSLYEVVSLLIK